MFHQRGVTLPEVLFAALLFSLTLLGLLRYQQVLLQSFQQQWQLRQAWELAHQRLEAFSLQRDGDNSHWPMENQWQMWLTRQSLTAECEKVSVTVVTPMRQQAQLSRWVCSTI